MNISTELISKANRAVSIAGVSLFLLAVSPPVTFSQDQPDTKKESSATPKADESASAKKAKGAARGGVDKVMDRARLLLEKLDLRKRKVDPFGMSMDPDDKIVIAEEAEADVPREATSLEEAVARFQVNGVVPKRHEVIVGARSLGVGDRVLIEHKEVNFKLTIVEVTMHRISLKDDETGEIATVELGIIPDLLPTSVARQGTPEPAEGISAMSADYEVESADYEVE